MKTTNRHLLDDLIYFTGCQLATYSIVKRRKSSAKSDVARHKKISDAMIQACETHGASQEALHAFNYQRLLIEED